MICYAKFKCNSHPDPDQRFHFHKLECPRSQAFLQLILGSNLQGRKVHEATLNGHFTPLTTKDFWKCTLGGFPSKQWTMPPWTLLTPSTFWRNLCCASRKLDGETRELISFNPFLWSRPLWSQWLWQCFFVALHTQIPQGFSESAVAMNIAGISPWGLVVGWKIWWLVPCPWAAWQRTVFG